LATRELTASDRAPSLPNRIVIDFLEGTTRRKDAIAFAKGFIDQHFDAPQASGWYVARYEDGYAFEIEAYNRTVGTEDRAEGIRAFNEKRKPQFKGQ